MKKNLLKFIGLITLAVIIGFGIVACDNGNGGGGSTDTRVALTAGSAVSVDYDEDYAFPTFTGPSGLSLLPTDFTITGSLSIDEVVEDDEDDPGTYYVVVHVGINRTTEARTFTVSINPASTAIKGSTTVVITQATAPANTAAIDDVGIDGLAVVGETLTVVAVDEDGNLVTNVDTVQWYYYDIDSDTNTAIASATSKTYTLVAGDEGKYITVSAKNPATAAAVFCYWRVGPIAPAGSVAKSITITGLETMNGINVWLYVYDPDDLMNQVSCNGFGVKITNGTATFPLKAQPDWNNPWYGSGEHYLVLEIYSEYYVYTNGNALTTKDDVVKFNITDANSTISWDKFKGPAFMSDLGL